MCNSIRYFSIFMLVGAAGCISQVPKHTLPANLAAPGSPELIKRQGNDVFGEGVAADWQGNAYFNEMGANNRTMQVKVGQDSARVWRKAKDAPNGMWLDTQGRLIICQTRAIVRVKPGAVFDDKTDTLYKYATGGNDFNDVTGDSKDNLYFTNFSGRSVYFRGADSGVTREVLSDRPRPNGIEWDEEKKIVYVCENEIGKVASYTVGADFSLTDRKEFANVPGADGIVLDEEHNVYAAAFGSAIHVFTPTGTKLGEIPIPDIQLTNLAFGGADFKTLFMVTNKGLFKLPMKVKGYKTGQPVSIIKSGMGIPSAAIPGQVPQDRYRADGRNMDGKNPDKAVAVPVFRK